MPTFSPYLTVAEALDSLNVAELKARAALFPESRSWSRKAEIIAEIRPYLEGDRLHSLWSRLDKLQQAAVSEVVHSETSTFDSDVFQAKYGEQPGFGTGANSRFTKPSLLDLFFYDGILPEDLLAALEEFVPEPEPLKVAATEDAPAVIIREYESFDRKTGKTSIKTDEIPLICRNTEAAAQEDLAAILQLVASGKLRVSDKTLMPSMATMTIVSATLRDADWYDVSLPDEAANADERPGLIMGFAWPLLLQAAGLVNVSSGRLEVARAGHAALTSRPADTLKAIWKKWLVYRGFDELRRINAIKGQTGKGKSYLSAPAKRRAAIAGALMNCPVGEWVTVDEFWRLIRANHRFEVTRDEWSLYVGHPEYGSLGSADYSWSLLQGRYILCLLFEYAAPLGIIDIAYTHPTGAADDFQDHWGTDDLEFFSRYDGLEYLRINPMGAYCLGIAQSYTPAAIPMRRTLRVLPNRDVVVVDPPLTAGDALLLDRFAISTSEGVWRLEQSKLLSALEEGHSLDPLHALLRDRTVGEVPDAVSRLLDETEQRGRKLRDCGAARLFECADPHVRTLITNDRRTRALCYAAGDQHIAVPTDKEKAFVRAVRELGYVVAG